MNGCGNRAMKVKSEANRQPLGHDHLLSWIVMRHDARYIIMPWGSIKRKYRNSIGGDCQSISSDITSGLTTGAFYLATFRWSLYIFQRCGRQLRLPKARRQRHCGCG